MVLDEDVVVAEFGGGDGFYGGVLEGFDDDSFDGGGRRHCDFAARLELENRGSEVRNVDG